MHFLNMYCGFDRNSFQIVSEVFIENKSLLVQVTACAEQATEYDLCDDILLLLLSIINDQTHPSK